VFFGDIAAVIHQRADIAFQCDGQHRIGIEKAVLSLVYKGDEK
jgi:hypothetical protein